MGSEISQFDIPGNQLLETDSQSRVGVWTDIGEAKISYTIFGKAKVRVIRKQDKIRRAALLTVLAVTVLATAAWQGWIALQRLQSVVPPPLSETVRVSPPAFEPAYIPLPAIPSLQESKPAPPPQTEVNDLMATLKSAQQAPLVNDAVQSAAKPVTPQPLTVSKPQVVPLATNNPVKNPVVVPQPPKPLPPRRPAAPSVVAKPSVVPPVSPTVVVTPAATKSVVPSVATPPATQPATSQPTAVAPLVQPSSKENTSTTSPAVTNQSLGPVNAQPQLNTQP